LQTVLDYFLVSLSTETHKVIVLADDLIRTAREVQVECGSVACREKVREKAKERNKKDIDVEEERKRRRGRWTGKEKEKKETANETENGRAYL
jgi:hypothetical protein